MGGLAKENALQEACGHISTKNEKQEGAGGGVEGSPHIQLTCCVSSDLAFGVLSQYCVSISSQLFHMYSIQGIGHSMISWHGLCPIWSNLYAFILRAAS